MITKDLLRARTIAADIARKFEQKSPSKGESMDRDKKFQKHIAAALLLNVSNRLSRLTARFSSAQKSNRTFFYSRTQTSNMQTRARALAHQLRAKATELHQLRAQLLTQSFTGRKSSPFASTKRLTTIVAARIPFGEVGTLRSGGKRVRLCAGAFHNHLSTEADVIARLGHSGEGGVELGRRMDGHVRFGRKLSAQLYCEISLTDDAIGRHVLDLVERGQITGLSAEWFADETVERDAVENVISARLCEVNLVQSPAAPAFANSRVWLQEHTSILPGFGETYD